MRTKIITGIIATFLIIPGFALAQESASLNTTIQQQINAIQEQVSSLSESITPPTEETPAIEPPRIKRLSPQRGPAGTEVTLHVNDKAVTGKDWSLHFGKDGKVIPQDDIKVIQIATTHTQNQPGAEVVFNVPWTLAADYGCKEREDGKGQVCIDPRPIQPGEYEIWIENKSSKTNTVEFTVTGDQTDTTKIKKLRDTYKDTFEFTATLEYAGNSTWRYTVKGNVPNPCYNLQTQYYESTKKLIAWISSPSGSKACTAVVDEVSAEGTMNTAKDADIQFDVEEDIPEEPADEPKEGSVSSPTEGNTGTTQEDNDTTKGNNNPTSGSTGPSEGSTGPEQGTTDRTTVSQADNATVQATLDRVQQQVQNLVEQVLGSSN